MFITNRTTQVSLKWSSIQTFPYLKGFITNITSMILHMPTLIVLAYLITEIGCKFFHKAAKIVRWLFLPKFVRVWTQDCKQYRNSDRWTYRWAANRWEWLSSVWWEVFKPGKSVKSISHWTRRLPLEEKRSYTKDGQKLISSY